MEKTEGVKKNIQWLCRDCCEKLRDTPGRTRTGKKYNIWEAGRWQKDGECSICHGWKLLTMYEMEDAEAKERKARRQAYRDRGYVRKKDTRARYREPWRER